MTSCSSQPYRQADGPPASLPVKLLGAGLAACMADLFTFPLDTAKVRLQIQGETSKGGPVPRSATPNPLRKHVGPRYKGMLGTIRVVAREEGARALYGGIAAGLQRQMCFASIRLGFYDDVKRKYQRLLGHDSSSRAGVGVRVLSGLSTGAMSVSVAHPTDVVKVRMQAQGASGSTKYTGVFQAYREIARAEGFRGLWKDSSFRRNKEILATPDSANKKVSYGYIPNMARNSVTNVAELVTYDMIKEYLLQHQLMVDNFPCHVVSGFGAGFLTTVVASPVDVVKTRYMNSSPGQYAGAMNCARTMMKDNGPAAFYKGFMPSFIRFGSWNILMFVCYEQLKRLLSRNVSSQYETITSMNKSKKTPPSSGPKNNSHHDIPSSISTAVLVHKGTTPTKRVLVE